MVDGTQTEERGVQSSTVLDFMAVHALPCSTWADKAYVGLAQGVACSRTEKGGGERKEVPPA